MHARDDAGIAGEPACRVEAIDGTDLALDNDGQDFAYPGKGLHQPDGGDEAHPLSDALFELSDLVLRRVESLELLSNATPRFRRKLRQRCP